MAEGTDAGRPCFRSERRHPSREHRLTGLSSAAIPDQRGRTAIVTGTGGLGLEVAIALAGAGAHVVLAGRNEAKGAESLARIRSAHPRADARFARLDLADLASIAEFASHVEAAGRAIDVLINNAGLMSPPGRRTTKDGFELQFGTNDLGHFALTGHLLPSLRRSNGARVVSVASLMHWAGRIDFDDLQGQKHYRAFRAYAQSKLAMLVFAQELQRRSDAHGWGITSIAAHPGYARTELIANGPAADGPTLFSRFTRVLQPILSQSAAMGALPIVFAATSPAVTPGGYYGPSGGLELKGAVSPSRQSHRSRDRTTAARLWAVSEALVGLRFGADLGQSAGP